MRARHSTHSLPAFPVYSAVFTATDNLVVGGGGGSSKSGIKNKLRLYSVGSERDIDLKAEYEVEDAPTSMTVDIESSSIICGINSSPEKILKGVNENCHIFKVADNAFQHTAYKSTLPASEDDYQKVTALSPDRKLLVVAGCRDLSLLSFPSLTPVAPPLHLEKEIYDATFSSTSETLIIATTHNLLVYSLKAGSPASSPEKGKGKSNLQEADANVLKLVHSVDLPSSIGSSGSCSFRSVRYHPSDDKVLYTVINTSPSRGRNQKSSARRGYISRWNTQTWTVEKQRKVGDKGLTAFDVSLDGRFLGYGSSDLSIGMLDSKTLSPLITILKAHEFPPTVVKFNPTTTLLASASADNTVRIATIPTVIGGSSWSLILFLLLTLLVLVVAFAIQNGNIRW